jgi:phosphate/sulfate permease
MLTPEAPSFDLIRATANLTIAAILIASATSLKLPLSTTYVTFMVAMGTSLADRAWGRESAVYRITGVLIVISGWFITALVAFTVAFLVAALLMWGHVYAIAALTLICAYILIISNRKKKEPETTEQKQEHLSVMNQCAKEISDSTQDITRIFNNTLEGVFEEDRKLLKQMSVEARALHKSASARKHSILPTLNKLKDSQIETGHYYVQVIDYLNEVTKALFHISKSSYEHIDNNHEGFSSDQLADLDDINKKMNVLFESVTTILTSNAFHNIVEAKALKDELFEYLAKAYKNQIRRDKNNQNTTRSSVLYYDILAEEKTIILQLRNLVNAQKHFVENN